MITERDKNGRIMKSTGNGSKRFCHRGHDKDIVGRYNRGCKKCKRVASAATDKNIIRNKRWKYYGILNRCGAYFTYIDYDRMYQIQKGQCAICGRHQSTLSKALDVDHDHKTGLVRGLLCSPCNTNLGRKENLEWNQKADQYLKTSPMVANAASQMGNAHLPKH